MRAVWGIVMISVAMFCCHMRSVHVVSSKRRREENAVVFAIEIANPTDRPVVATIGLTIGTCISEKGSPSGTVTSKFPVAIPAGKTILFEKRFSGVNAKLMGPVHSAHVVGVRVNSN